LARRRKINGGEVRVTLRGILAAAILISAAPQEPPPADWPQFMRDPSHTGSAADESLRTPLGLALRVRLDDAVLTSPALVAGRAYVVDQMGTAYAIDARSGKILWKSSPDGPHAMGFNTSSPCVVQGRVCFGTTAGTFHLLDAADGRVLKTLDIRSPILSSPTAANGALYFQALDAVLRSVDLEGKERWRWDHYRRFEEPRETAKALDPVRGGSVMGMFHLPSHGGGDVAVSGARVVTSFGWDAVCLEDAGTEARLLWCNRAPTGGDGSAPMSPSISGDWVYLSGMGADGVMAITRLSLGEGKVAKEGRTVDATPWSTPAVRGAMVSSREGSHWYGKTGLSLFDFDARQKRATWTDEKEGTPRAASEAFAKEHLVAVTLRGEALVLDLAGKASRYQTPGGKGIGSSPAISGGRVYFGSDDGYLYILGPEGNLSPKVDDAPAIHEPRSPVRSAAGRSYGWPTTWGNAANTLFVNDPDLKPPLRLRWASRAFGHHKTPGVAQGGDLFSVTLQGLVTCQEQATGRMRWRTALPGPESWSSAGLLVYSGRLFVPRPVYGNGHKDGSTLYCLDVRTGRLLWSSDIGGRGAWERSPAVAAGDLVAFGAQQSVKEGPPVAAVQAFEMKTGREAWRVDLDVRNRRTGDIAGASDGKTLYFTAGAGDYKLQPGERKGGEAAAIDAASGKVLWRSTDPYASLHPVLAGDRLLLNEYFGDLTCVSAAEGKVFWKRKAGGYDHLSAGPDYLVLRGYGGHGFKVRLEDGKDDRECRELGGEGLACGEVALTPEYSFAITVGGLHVREVRTGKLLWRSPGFAPRACVNPVLADGRIFWTSGASGMVFCWEPEK
jgi:outer membrane protein assembly factor BamB